VIVCALAYARPGHGRDTPIAEAGVAELHERWTATLSCFFGFSSVPDISQFNCREDVIHTGTAAIMVSIRQ
jgi:hypothetical protein